MKIGIIGPNKIYDILQTTEQREALLNNLAEIIVKSGSEIVLTPDKDSLLEYFGNKFNQLGGKKIWLVLPTNELNYTDYLNTDLGEIISCDNWDRQADEYNRQSDIFICTGYAWGALKEIACAQYFNKKKIYILNEFISQKLPVELNFLVEYISINELSGILENKYFLAERTG